MTATGIAGAAYTNNDLTVMGAANTATTLFELDANLNQLAIQSPPNNGILAATGLLGVDPGAAVGFDIYSALDVDGMTIRNIGVASLVGGRRHRPVRDRCAHRQGSARSARSATRSSTSPCRSTSSRPRLALDLDVGVDTRRPSGIDRATRRGAARRAPGRPASRSAGTRAAGRGRSARPPRPASRRPRTAAPRRLLQAVQALGVEVARHDQMEVDVRLGARAPGAQPVHVDPLRRARAVEARRRARPSSASSASSSRPPSARRTSFQPSRTMFSATASATAGSSQRDARELHRQQPEQHARAGPDVGQEVAPVGDAARASPCAARRARDGGRGTPFSRLAPATSAMPASRRCGTPPPTRSRSACTPIKQRRHDDQRALDAGRQELRLAVAVGVIAVGRLRRDAQAPHQQQRRHHVDDRLHRVGEHRDGAGHDPGRDLGGEDEHADGERETSGPEARVVRPVHGGARLAMQAP